MAALHNDREGMTSREGGGCGEAEVGHPREDNFTQEGAGKVWLQRKFVSLVLTVIKGHIEDSNKVRTSRG